MFQELSSWHLTSHEGQRTHSERYVVVFGLFDAALEVSGSFVWNGSFQRINHNVRLQRQRVNSDIFGHDAVRIPVSEYAVIGSCVEGSNNEME